MIDKELIISYINSGLSVVPVNGDNGRPAKAPATTEWKKYQTQRMPLDRIDTEFSRANAIGVIGGNISGNLEVIDFDNHDGLAKDRFSRLLFLLGDMIKANKIPYEKTPSGGYHLFYRAKNAEGNQKLSQKINLGKKDTIVETRGEGGYVVASPSKGYVLTYGCLTDVPTITDDERTYIINICKSFNEVVDNFVDSKSIYQSCERRPGDDYNADARGFEEAKTLLKRAGWTNPYTLYWTRPGKEGKAGVSATFGVAKPNGVPLLHVFSSNAEPFKENKNYSPFAVFAILGHNGDFSKAASELVDEGYGDQRGHVSNRKELPKEVKAQFIATATKEPPKKGKREKKSEVTEVKAYLRNVWDFRLNVINNVIEARKNDSEWGTVNENDVWMDVNEYGIKMRKDNIKSILGSSFVPEYNAFREYFENLYEWDGTDWFAELSKLMTIDDPKFFRDMLEKHFVRAIKCALEDDYYNRMVFVLQSKNQEIGKSRFIHYINPFGNKYFSEQPLSEQKDCQIALSQTFIYNLEELDDLKTNRVSSIKANLAKSTILERRPYGTQSSIMPRRCTFFASTNYSEFLVDDVNTRWLIFRVDAIDPNLWAKTNIDDLWAQAWTLYKDPSYEYELTPEEKMKREERNKAFTETPLETGLIIKYFERSDSVFMTVAEIMGSLAVYAGYGLRLTKNPTSISQQLDTMGFKYVEDKVYGMSIRRYGIKVKNM